MAEVQVKGLYNHVVIASSELIEPLTLIDRENGMELSVPIGTVLTTVSPDRQTNKGRLQADLAILDQKESKICKLTQELRILEKENKKLLHELTLWNIVVRKNLQNAKAWGDAIAILMKTW